MITLTSPCLVGIRTRWDESCDEIEGLINLVKSGQAVFLCPEQLGGLTTPREPSEIETGTTAKEVLEGEAKVLTIIVVGRVQCGAQPTAARLRY